MFRPLEELIHAHFVRTWPIATRENQHPASKDPSASVSDELRLRVTSRTDQVINLPDLFDKLPPGLGWHMPACACPHADRRRIVIRYAQYGEIHAVLTCPAPPWPVLSSLAMRFPCINAEPAVAPVHELLDKIISYLALAFQHGQNPGAENFLKMLHLALGKHIKGPTGSEKAVSDYGVKKCPMILYNKSFTKSHCDIAKMCSIFLEKNNRRFQENKDETYGLTNGIH